MPDLPDWRHLSSFLSVARTGRLTVAARREGVDHSTLSRHIAALEASLGAKLFERRPDGLTLTSDGERLQAAVEQMENQLAAARNDIAGRDLAVAGSVRVGAPDGIGAAFLAPRLSRFVCENPRLDVQIVAMPRLFNLTRREADIAIALSPPESGRLSCRKLTDYTLGLYASAEFLSQHAPIRSVADIESDPFIGYIDDLIFAPQLDYLGELVPGARAGFTSSNLIAQMAAVRAGGGFGILPKFLVADAPDLVRVLPEEVSLTRSFWLIVHADHRQVARIRAVIDFLTEETRRARSLFL